MTQEQLPPTYLQLLFYEYTIERLPAHQAWTSLAISLTSLLICLVFLYASIRVWRTKCAVAAIPTVSEPILVSSPIEDVINLYQDDKGRKLSNASLSSAACSFASSSTSHYSPPPSRTSDDIDVCALIALSWGIVTVDQVSELVVFVSHQTACPTFSCFDGAPTITRDCPIMYPAALLGSLAQPVGMCLFVLATMIRFVRVYSVLSRVRYLALMSGSVLAISATAFRLAAIAVHQSMPLWLYRGRLTPVYQPQGPAIGSGDDLDKQEPSFVGPQDTLINTISIGTGWSLSIALCVYTVCALMAVGLGMQFIASVRNQVSQTLHRPSSEVGQVAADVGRGKTSSPTAAAREVKHVRTTVILMAAAAGCLGCFFLAMRTDIVQSDQIAVSLVNLVFRMIMALVSLAMVRVNELVVRGNQTMSTECDALWICRRPQCFFSTYTGCFLWYSRVWPFGGMMRSVNGSCVAGSRLGLASRLRMPLVVPRPSLSVKQLQNACSGMHKLMQ